MQLKYFKTLNDAQENEFEVSCLAWSPNNQKLAIATSERQIILFDDKGDKRDRFSTKPFDPEAGKKSYVITGLAFGPDSTKLAVAQSDCIVYVYKTGENWGDKKAICNKFQQPAPVTCITWLLSGLIISGLTDGKVRALHVKSNKSQNLYTADSLVVSLAPNSRGTGFLSGHMDGKIIRFFLTDKDNQSDSQGHILNHNVAPYILCWPQGHIFAAGFNKQLVVYDRKGKIIKTFDYTKNDADHEFTVGTCNSSGQAVIVGSYDKLRLFTWNVQKAIWEESCSKEIKNIYSITSIAWKYDGSRVVCGGLFGSVLMFESVLKRTVWKDIYEITYVGPSQVLLKSLKNDGKDIVIQSQNGAEIDNVKIMGKDKYVVTRTNNTLILVDLIKNLISEVTWVNSERNEKFYFENPNVCLIFNAGELSLIEYGEDDILSSVRTEFCNPHLISVRLNERKRNSDNKKLAYLIDLKTICVVDLITGILCTQINHESKIDWLELNETGHKLLFRDKRQRLMLVDISSSEKLCIFSDVSFVQWVEESDVAVAQAGTNLAVWYNIDLPEHTTIIPIKGEVVDIVRANGKTTAVCVEGSNEYSVELDEGLVEFGTAISDKDYGRAILYLETKHNVLKAEAMWHHLSNIAMKAHDLVLAKRCNAALQNVATTFYLNKIEEIGKKYAETNHDDISNCPDVWISWSVINYDLNTAENVYIEQGNTEAALEMYKKLHKWNEALRLAEKLGYEKLSSLKKEYMKILLETGRFEKAGQVLETEGKYKEAMDMYMKTNHVIKIPNMLLKHHELLEDQTIVTTVIKNCLRHELYEAAAEIYEKLDKPDLALSCYRKGKVWNKAVDLARIISPDQVVSLEKEWGNYLIENKQMDAAINHYVEAGCTYEALEAAVSGRQWKKAVHIIQVIEDRNTVSKFYDIIAKYFCSIKDYSTAEKMYILGGMYTEAVEMYNKIGQWDKAQNLASKYLDKNDLTDMYIKEANNLENAGKLKEAEKLYISVDAPDLAIAMYKRVEQYDNMIRLVKIYHPDLLQTTHLHLGQHLESEGKYRASEGHYLAASEWKAAMNMYRSLSMWEEAYRVAKQNGGSAASNQVAFLWARSLPIDSAIKLLKKYGILESCIDYACETYQFDFAFSLCKNLSSKINEVHYKYAMALEDDGKFSEAEAEFILAEKPKEAILMYIHNQNWINALRLAESYEPNTIPEVLQAQAAQCFNDKQFSEFEVLLLRAQMPELIVQKYKSEGMWVDALRICKDYLPTLYPSIQAEYDSSNYNKTTDMDIETLLSRANEWALAGQHRQAIDCLLQINSTMTELSIMKRALLRAADMTNKFLFGQEALDVIKILSPRLIEIGEYNVAAQLYINVDLMKEAIDSFIIAEDWNRARKVARELEPAYGSYVETKYKDRLLKEGNVEQLADVDIIGALDLLVEQGQWLRCIEKAKMHSMPVLHKYLALYATHLIKNNNTMDALNLYITHGTPAMPQNFNIYNHIAADLFSLPDNSGPESYPMWAQLRQMLFEINEGLQITSSSEDNSKKQFKKLLLIAHYYAIRSACRQVPSLKTIAAQISVSLLRYTDIIAADKAFYEAGTDIREEGKLSEAFVFLNHYLDICDAVEEEDDGMLDYSDLSNTDIPTDIPLPAQLYLSDDLQKHDSIREWVLSVSMDQKVNQFLPVDERHMYEASLQPGEAACIVSGYPLKNQIIRFSKSSYQANKDVWMKLNMAAKISPDSNVSNVISFIIHMCGTPES